MLIYICTETLEYVQQCAWTFLRFFKLGDALGGESDLLNHCMRGSPLLIITQMIEARSIFINLCPMLMSTPVERQVVAIESKGNTSVNNVARHPQDIAGSPNPVQLQVATQYFILFFILV